MMKVKRKMKYHLLRLFRLRESPHQVAAGFTLGIVAAWFPTFGLGPIIAIGLAKLMRVNTVAAIVADVIGTLSWPLLFLLNYQVGSLILDRKPKVEALEEVDYIDALNHTLDGIDSVHSTGYIFITGAIVNILISSILIYILVYFLFKKYRMRILRKISNSISTK